MANIELETWGIFEENETGLMAETTPLLLRMEASAKSLFVLETCVEGDSEGSRRTICKFGCGGPGGGRGAG